MISMVGSATESRCIDTQRPGAGIHRGAPCALQPDPGATAGPARRRAGAHRRWRLARFPPRDLSCSNRRVDRPRGAARPQGSACRDHRTDGSKDAHQCAQLGCHRVHGGLRGFELPDVGEHHRGTGESPRCGQRHDHLLGPRRTRVRAPRPARDATGTPPRVASPREALPDRRITDLRQPL